MALDIGPVGIWTYGLWQGNDDAAEAVAELVQPILVEAEIVGQFVQHCDADLILEHGRIAAELLDERPPEDADPVGDGARPVAAVRQRRALVEPEEIAILAGFLLDRDLDVRDGLGESGG